MASRIITKKGSGAPLASDLVHGELAVDTVNKRLYTENAGGTIIELGTAPSTIDINAGTIDGTVIGGSSAAAGSFTTISASGEIAANGGVAFGDNDKATFGDGDDLQIYHDGSHSYISDQGTGNLRLLAENFQVRNPANNEAMMIAIPNFGVTLYYNNNDRLATTSTGIDVTGTVTADGLTVDGNASAQTYRSSRTDGDVYIQAATDTDFVRIGTQTKPKLFNIDGNGDISFYEDTGTTAKFFWDASAERLGIGTTSAGAPLEVLGEATTSTDIAHFSNSNGSQKAVFRLDSVGAGELVLRDASNNEDVVISSQGDTYFNAGNVGIGTTSPNSPIDINRSSTDGAIATFRKDGITVGSIGANSGTPYMSGNLGGFRLTSSGGAGVIIPTDTTGAASDADNDLGVSSARWRNLYLSGGVYVNSPSGSPILELDAPTAINRLLAFETAGKDRWALYCDGSAETGSNAGSDLRIARYNDAGTYVSAPLVVPRNTGVFQFSHGISFDGGANVLDDYEEGTYTATLTPSSSGTITLEGANNELAYTKVGRLVTVHGRVIVNSVSSPVGYIRLSLPFTVASNTDNSDLAASIGYVTGASTLAAMDFQGFSQPSTSEVRIYDVSAGTNSATSANDVIAVTSFYFNFSYLTT